MPDIAQTLPARTDKPVHNTDGSLDIYFGSTPPGEGKNSLATLPGKGWFTIFRLYGPTRAFFEHSWKLDDVVKQK